jgi:hypothetical protein
MIGYLIGFDLIGFDLIGLDWIDADILYGPVFVFAICIGLFVIFEPGVSVF